MKYPASRRRGVSGDGIAATPDPTPTGLAPDHPRSGTVSWISPKAEFTPKNVQTKEDRVKLVFAVKISLQNPDGFFKPGLPADAAFRAGDGAGAPQ